MCRRALSDGYKRCHGRTRPSSSQGGGAPPQTSLTTQCGGAPFWILGSSGLKVIRLGRLSIAIIICSSSTASTMANSDAGRHIYTYGMIRVYKNGGNERSREVSKRR